MKKIISRYYLFIAFLLVIADQKFSGLVLRSNLVTGLSDFAYYMGGGLIFAVLFRVTKSIYWPIGLHIVYNGIGQLLMLL